MQRMNSIRPNWLIAAVLASICASAAVATTPVAAKLPGVDTVPDADAVADAQVAPGPVRAALPVDPAASPSKLDYVVLASLADSSSLLSMTSFRAAVAAASGDK